MRKLATLAVFTATALFGQAPEVITPVNLGVSPPFRSLSGQIAPPSNAGEFDMPKVSRATLTSLGAQNRISPSLTTPNSPTFYQTTVGNLPVTVAKNFAGMGNGYNASWTNQSIVPPDTTMAVGPTQIVQWVNVRLSVMDKNGVPQIGGALGYINGNAIWTGLPAGSVCRDFNQGDPIVQYDRIADRWVLSQFAFSLATATNGSGVQYPAAGSYRQCIAVSQTGDATGAYNLFEYSYAAFPDYGKIGVWPDGYYITYNNFTFSTVTGGSGFAGAMVCAYNRSAMLTVPQVTANAVCFSGMTNRFSHIPADLDGSTLPPAGAPNYIVSQDWFFKGPPYSILLQKFHVDFVTPGNSTFTDGLGGAFNSFIQMPMPDLLGACEDAVATLTCVAQPATVRVLDTLSMRPMYRLAYRNRGPGLESLVFTHTIDPPNASLAGINWVEIRNPGAATPVMAQNGALNPSGDLNRWMGSAAMDKQGNIALGYSVSSSTVFPGIRIAGRLRSDIPSRLRGELNVATGTGSQTTTAQRWGDYSTMQIDPTDDCTFWYTQEYMNNTSFRDWATRIVAFKFPSCN